MPGCSLGCGTTSLPWKEPDSCQNAVSQKLGGGPGNVAVPVISCLSFPARPFPGLPQRWSLRPVLLLISAIRWLKLLSDFQLKLIYGAFIRLVLFQACPLVPIPALVSSPLRFSREVDRAVRPCAAPACWAGAQLRLRAARRLRVYVRPV